MVRFDMPYWRACPFQLYKRTVLPFTFCPISMFLFLRNNGIDYMELRLWIGIHSCIQCFLLVATDASYIIKYMTRFTEEGFSSLISFIFISDAIKKMVSHTQARGRTQTQSRSYLGTHAHRHTLNC